MRNLFLLSTLVLLQACPFVQPEGTGECETDDGIIDTYNIVGVWKQIPDESVPGEAELYEEGNFYLLYVVHLGSAVTLGVPTAGTTLRPESSVICEKYVSGGFTDYLAESAILKFGTWYTGRDSSRTKFLNTTLTENFPPKTTVRNQIETNTDIKYQFTGSCGSTKLHLSRRLMDSAPVRKDENGRITSGPRMASYTLFGINPPIDSCKATPLNTPQ